MKARITACLGIFAVMALSNAIVPDLPAYASNPSLQGAIYAAYFLGAFLLTVPAGLLSDRYGSIPVMRTGLFVTILSGIFLMLASSPFIMMCARLLEGIGAGIFVASSMSFINSLHNHERMSGFFMASLNGGLITGLVAGGILAIYIPFSSPGVLLFTAICIIPATGSISLRNGIHTPEGSDTGRMVPLIISEYRWLWYSAIVLIGVTGVAASLYPGFSAAPPSIDGIWIAAMSAATVITALIASNLELAPVPTIRMAALFMAAGILLSYFTPAGFIVIGAIAGIIMIAQMAFLADVGRQQQGIVMGIYSATSYLGMSLLSFLAGMVAESTSFFMAFCATALASVSVAITISWCSCRKIEHTKPIAGELE